MSAATAATRPAVAAEPARKLRSIEELTRDFRQRRTESLEVRQHQAPPNDHGTLKPSPHAAVPTRYGRDALLALRHASQLLPVGGQVAALGLRCVAVKLAPPRLPRAAKHFQDPALDDERLLVRLEEREAREAGADAMNEETFGADATGWSFEAAVEANARLLVEPLKQRVVAKGFDQCASTASGSRTQSEGPSSVSSTPRAAVPAPSTSVPHMFNPHATPFVPSTLNVDAEPYYSLLAASVFQ